MEVTESMLWGARFAVLAFIYLFLLIVVLMLRADARAATMPRREPAPERPQPMPAPSPAPAPRPALPPAAPVTSPRSAATGVAVKALVFLSGTTPTTGKEYPLFGPLDVGRSDASDISIPNRFVSTHHARIYQQNGVWMIEDLGSTNGTLVNDVLLTVAQPLTPGDRICFGDSEFSVK